MRVAVYNENCIRAGRIAADEAAIDAYIGVDGDICGDWTVYEQPDLAALAREGWRIEATATPGASGQHQRRVGRSLQEYAGLPSAAEMAAWEAARNAD